MGSQLKSKAAVASEESDIYYFRRLDGRWYIDLPGYENTEGVARADLELTQGAPKFLNSMANGAYNLQLRLTTEPADGLDFLELVDHCDAPRGGAVYEFVAVNQQSQGSLFWICDLALFVFGDMPERIYVERIGPKSIRAKTLLP